MANVAAGCGIEALIITQDKRQIESLYGKGDTASILGSYVIIRIFGPGRAYFETANWVANALGDQTVLTRRKQSAAMTATSANGDRFVVHLARRSLSADGSTQLNDQPRCVLAIAFIPVACTDNGCPSVLKHSFREQVGHHAVKAVKARSVACGSFEIAVDTGSSGIRIHASSTSEFAGSPLRQ